jgi:hypothetical protein
MRRATQAVVPLRVTTKSFCGSSNPVSGFHVRYCSISCSISVPDNYTDEATFLDHLQRNPQLQPYEFWSLMSDATIIAQHLASVVIFCCCFVAIIHGRVSPVAVVGWASLCTLLAWALWDYWEGHKSDPSSATTDASIVGKDGSKKTTSSRSTQQRLTTAKSAALIYAALLGLSPILKSLTRSTTSDSIWALSTWLLLMNVAFFDYSGGPGTQCVLQ